MNTHIPRTDELRVGTGIERYRIEKTLGRGGFGITYLVSHVEMGKKFALKEHLPSGFATRDPSSTQVTATDGEMFARTLDMFFREGRALANLQHPNLANVADVFRANGTAYIVLAYESGPNLRKWRKDLRRAPTQQEMDRLTFPLLDALRAVHSQGLLHRDIAPDNIIIRPDGSPCLIDFGAARETVSESSLAITRITKPGYSPIEQHSGRGKDNGPWSDLYAFGATLYFAVTGNAPIDSVARQIDDELPPVELACEDPSAYRSSFLQAINTCLNLKLVDRFQSVDAVLAVLNPQHDIGGYDALSELPEQQAAVEPKQKVVTPDTEVTGSPKLNPQLAASYFESGNLWYSKAEYYRAIEDYSAAVELDPKHAAAYSSRGISWHWVGDNDRAISDCNNAIELDPYFSWAYSNRGLSWHAKGEYDKAIVDYNIAIELNPTLAIAYSNRGLSWHVKGDYEKAIVDLNKAIELNPMLEIAFWNRGINWEDKGQLHSALADLIRFTELAPNNPDGPIAVARVREKISNDPPQTLARRGVDPSHSIYSFAAAAVVLVLPIVVSWFVTVHDDPKRHDDKSLCVVALNESQQQWESDKKLSAYVEEAKKRKLTPQKCRSLIK